MESLLDLSASLHLRALLTLCCCPILPSTNPCLGPTPWHPPHAIDAPLNQRTLDRGRVVAARRRLDAQREDLQVRDRREARRGEGLAERVRRVARDVGVGAAVAPVAGLRDVPGHEPRAAREVRLDEEPPQEGHAVLAGRLGPELLALPYQRRLRRAAAVRHP